MILDTLMLLAFATPMVPPTVYVGRAKVAGTTVTHKLSTSNAPLYGPASRQQAATEFNQLKSNPVIPFDRKLFVCQELQNYLALADEWDGPGSKSPRVRSIKLAQSFLDMLPAGLPIPKPTLSSSGEVSLYWNNASVYADVSFDEVEGISVYSRTKHKNETETFVDSLMLSELSAEWFHETFSLLTNVTDC